MIKLRAYGNSHTGMVRKNNEDNFVIVDNMLFVIADGMGGHSFGEIASKKAVNIMANLYEIEKDILNSENVENRIYIWVKEVNNQIYKENIKNNSMMGTTMVFGIRIDKKLIIGNIGDSRAYRISPSLRNIEQITMDHSLVAEQIKLGIITEEEAKNYPKRNIITRALGPYSDIELDIFKCDLKTGDYYLFCSDGLTNMVSDNEILNVILDDILEFEGKVNRLIQLANQAGGKDNITLILVGVEND